MSALGPLATRCRRCLLSEVVRTSQRALPGTITHNRIPANLRGQTCRERPNRHLRRAARMMEDEYKVELAKYKARVAELERAEVELVSESHQDEQRRGEWLKWYDAALAKSPPDEREIEAYMAAVEHLRNRAILRKVAFERIRDNFDNLKRPRRAKRTWWNLVLKS